MSQEQTPNTEDQASDAPTEKSLLLARARLMGLSPSNNIGIENLRKLVADKQAADDAEDPPEVPEEEEFIEPTPEPEPEPQVPAVVAQPVKVIAPTANPLAPAKPVKKLTLRQYMQQEQMKLVRLRITNMDPKKKDLPGEILTVANEYLGTVRKYIPYGEATDEGYHVPFCLYKQMEDRKFLNIRTIKDRATGQLRVENNWAKEFSLEVLEPLTQEELDKLATAQAAAGSVPGSNT